MKSASISILLMVVAFLVTNVIAAPAASPSEYKQRIDEALTDVEKLQEDLSGGNAENERRRIDLIFEVVPSTEKVEWPGSSIETDNQWLKTSLEQFLGETNEQKRRAVLSAISERLSALSISVGELDNAIKGESTKDSDKQKLAEILSREEYQKPVAKEESLFQKWWRQFWEWLESLFPKPSLTPVEGPNLAPLRLVLQVLVFAAVVAIVAFLLWRFVPYFSNWFRARTKEERGTRVILGETIGVDESATDLFREAESLARTGDLRGAIRKGYIAVLCELGDRKIVRLARHKTNRDYLRDVRKREGIYEGMSRLTNSFERNWYGLREAAPSEWEDFRTRYQATVAEARARGG